MRYVVVNLEEGVVRPASLLGLVVILDSSADTRLTILRDASSADVEHFVGLPVAPRRFLLVENINSASNVRNLIPLAAWHIKSACFDDPQRGLLWHVVARKF